MIETDRERFERVWKSLPESFGLRGFGGLALGGPVRLFSVGRSDSSMLQSWGTSYRDDGDVLLYIVNDKGEAFCKATYSELRREWVAPRWR